MAQWLIPRDGNDPSQPDPVLSHPSAQVRAGLSHCEPPVSQSPEPPVEPPLSHPQIERTDQMSERRTCQEPGCVNVAHKGRLWCNTHIRRMEKYGTRNPSPEQMGKPGRKRQAEVGYMGQHSRLRRALGPASDHTCAGCGQQAREWAYKGDHQEERIGHHGESVMAYAIDLDAYQPMCRPCHVDYDRRTA